MAEIAERTLCHCSYRTHAQCTGCPAVSKRVSQRSDWVPTPDKVKTPTQNKPTTQQKSVTLQTGRLAGSRDGVDEKEGREPK